MIEMAKKGWVDGLVLNVRRIGMRVVNDRNWEEIRSMRLPFDDLIEEIRPMERVYLHELKEIIDEFEGIVMGIWNHQFFVMDMRHDLDEFENELSLQEQWSYFKGELSYISDRFHPQRIARVATMLAIMKDELEYFEKSEDNRLLRFDGDEDRMNEYEKRLMGRKVKE